MERTRDAVHPSHGEHYGQSGGVTEGDAGDRAWQRVTCHDAKSYLVVVKDAFQDQPEKYKMFLEIMLDFKTERIDTVRVMARVKELFKGYNSLIHGFNTFLPEGYEIAPDEPKKPVSFEEAVSFVTKVKECFRNEEHVYQSFLDVLNRSRCGNESTRVVFNEVAGLFAGHPDLLEEFVRFLPENFQHREELSSTTTLTSRQLEMDRTRQARMVDSHAEDEVAIDRLNLDDLEEIMKVLEDKMKRLKGRILLKISAICSLLAALTFLLASWIYRGN